MKHFLVLLLSTLFVFNSYAQQARIDFETNKCLSGSNYLAYPGPEQETLTNAPKGYKPFYISHYGRHGSRYLINPKDYLTPYFVLSKADSLGKLSDLGKDVLRRVTLLNNESSNRYGELTELGGQQHKQIAKRMYERFPEVFADSASIQANSTIVIRCILSMSNALQQYVSLNPCLKIKHDASEHDMYYMNFRDDNLKKQQMPDDVKKIYEDYVAKNANYERVIKSLFNDEAYIKQNVDAKDLNYRLFQLASNLQSTEMRKQITLYDIFTTDELYANWKAKNAWWYINYGPSPLNGGKQPYSQRNLLKKIISQADSCIALEKPGATLRYGHETMVMPLTCLLGLNGFDKQIQNFDDLESNGWLNYKIFPMGANIQFIFYRRNPDDKDVIFKILLNENEARLPLETDKYPYYNWEKFKKHYLEKIEDYEENN